VAGALFVAYEDVLDVRIQHLVVYGQDRTSGITEDLRDAPVLQHLKQCSRASHFLLGPGNGIWRYNLYSGAFGDGLSVNRR
jgi:hypothetical protein